jgi:predicted GIY-YIG superfamily endonuclease
VVWEPGEATSPSYPIIGMEKAYRVYVLENELGKYYIGLSKDVERRLEQHNTGQSKWTA